MRLSVFFRRNAAGTRCMYVDATSPLLTTASAAMRSPLGEPDAGRAPRRRFDFDLGDFTIQQHRAADLGEQPHERADERAGAAHREPHAPLLLQRMDQRIDRRALEGVAADEQRMEAEYLPQPLVAEVAVHELRDRLVRLQSHEIRHDLEHVASRGRTACRSAPCPPRRSAPSPRRTAGSRRRRPARSGGSARSPASRSPV